MQFFELYIRLNLYDWSSKSLGEIGFFIPSNQDLQGSINSKIKIAIVKPFRIILNAMKVEPWIENVKIPIEITPKDCRIP